MQIKPILFILTSVFFFGTISFAHFEKIGLFDAFYWVFVTITTVGFGDIVPTTIGGKITFFLVALGGIGTLALVLQQIVSVSTQAQLKKMLGLNKIKLKNHIIVVNYNETAEEIIKKFKKENKDFILLLKESKNINKTELNAKNIEYIVGNITNYEIYERANIQQASTLIISTEDDAETLMISLVARKMNNDIKIVATCLSKEHIDMMQQANINYIISASEIDGILLSNTITEPAVTDFITDAISTRPGLDFRQIMIEKEQKLSEVEIKDNEKVVALKRQTDPNQFKFLINLKENEILNIGDCLIIIHNDFE